MNIENRSHVETAGKREPEEKRKLRILAGAEKLFLHRGFSGASMRDIAKNAEVSLGNLYNHFANKEEIFDSLIEMHSPATEIEKLMRFVEEDRFPVNMIEFAASLKNIVDNNMVFIRLVDIDGVEFGGKKTLRIITESVARVGGPLSELFEKHIEMGYVRPMDTKIGLPFFVLMLAAIFVVGNRFGIFEDLRLLGKDENYVLRQITDILMLGMLPR